MMYTTKKIPMNLWLYPRMGIFEPILIQILVRNILIGNDEKRPNVRLKPEYSVFLVIKLKLFLVVYILFKMRTKTGMTIN